MILILTIVGELVKHAVVVEFVTIRAGHCWNRKHTIRLYKHTMLYSQWKHQQS